MLRKTEIAKQLSHLCERRSAYAVFIEKFHRNRTLEGTKRTCKYNIKIIMEK
jgi:hypothetical protein